MSSIETIKKNFEDLHRIDHDKASYDLPHNSKQKIDPFESHREDFLFNEINKLTPKKILDVGCGIGHLVSRFLKNNTHCSGIDLSENMIATAKELLLKQNFHPELVSRGDIFTYQSNQGFDTIIANGVVWYYEDKTDFLKKIHSLATPQANIWVVHRNLFFNMYALNQGTFDLFSENFFSHLELQSKNSLTDQLHLALPSLSEKVHRNGELHKPYDNPLTIHTLYDSCQMSVENIYYTYIHPTPPRFNQAFPPEKYAELQKAFGKHWAGMFMGSQFIVHATCQ